jgi:peptide/nickel transport system substrate-binding protein
VPGLTSRRSAIAGLLAIALLTGSACDAIAPSPSPSRTATATNPPSESTPPAQVIDLTKTSYAADAGTDGGSLVVGDWQQASQFNPYYLGQGSEPAVASAAWATLITVTHDRRYLPDLAVTVPTVDNGGVASPGEDEAMTVKWTLREGLKWSDGEALTCDDFKYTWEWILDKDNFGVVTAGYDDIEDVECKSDTEMVWHFKAVYEGYLGLLPAPLPRHTLEPIPMDQQTQGVGFRPDEIAKLPVSGPFLFQTVTPDVEIRMAKNPAYLSPRTGKPAHLDSLTFRWYPDQAALIAAYRAGAVDVATGFTDLDLPKLVELGEQVSTRPSLTYEVLRPNWSDETCAVSSSMRDRGVGCPMSDPAIRRALALAIDRNAIISKAFGRTGAAPGTNVDPLAWFYADERAPALDPTGAIGILEEAGWKDTDGDGIRENDGLVARVELCTTDRQARLDAAALIKASLRDVGIEAVTTVVDPADMFATYDRSSSATPCALQRGHFDLALHSLTSSIDPRDYYFKYHSSQFEPDGQNDARVNNVGIDVALETVSSSVHPAVIRDAMIEFQEIYVEQTVEIPIYVSETVELHAAKVGNAVGGSPVGGATWNVADWFVKG